MAETLPILTSGRYALAAGCTASIVRGIVTIRQKAIHDHDAPRCYQCRHYGRGYISYNGSSYSRVCLLKPKTNSPNTGYPRRFMERRRYFAAYPKDYACDRFELKEVQ